MAKRKKTNNDLQSTMHKTKDRVTRTTLNTGDEIMYPGRVSGSCSASGARRKHFLSYHKKFVGSEFGIVTTHIVTDAARRNGC
jgi:capsule polysaccharide modification protein KpsS